MSDPISNNVNYQPSSELRDLVDKMIDDRLLADERDRLESLLESDSKALSYCAERVHFHAELEESMTPVRVEITQQRHIIFEKKGGLASVSRALTNVVKIENPKHGKAVELPPNLTTQAKFLSYSLGAICLMGLIALIFLFTREPLIEVTPKLPPKLVFRNASFEALEINQKSPPYIFTILEWQDYFQTEHAKVCDVERVTDGKRSAKDGQYAVTMNRGFLTQRLTYNDGTPFKARKGLKLRISGWAMLENAGKPCTLSIATRVVASAYPSMRQVEPNVKEIVVDSTEWQKISVDLSLPSDSLVMRPNITKVGIENDLMDITGLNLAISIDNQSTVDVFLDAMTIEEIK